MELKEVKNQHFVDFPRCRCKITDVSGRIRTIGFTVYFNEYGKYVFEVDKKDEKYCVV